MHEPVEMTIASLTEIKHVHRGQLWIDADDEPCMVFITGISTHLRAALLDSGDSARFPLRLAPAGTQVTLTQEITLEPDA
jgi:hypothetical protein